MFLDRLTANDRDALLSYNDAETYRDGGQGGFEIRTFIAVAGAVDGAKGEIWHYDPVPDLRRRLHGRGDGDRVTGRYTAPGLRRGGSPTSFRRAMQETEARGQNPVPR